ncbi:hypothetical protein Efla_000957 [Eimeria flavescens]
MEVFIIPLAPFFHCIQIQNKVELGVVTCDEFGACREFEVNASGRVASAAKGGPCCILLRSKRGIVEHSSIEHNSIEEAGGVALMLKRSAENLTLQSRRRVMRPLGNKKQG